MDENRVLTLVEVLALPDGARVWVEDAHNERYGGEHFKVMLDNGKSALRRTDQPTINARFLQYPYFGTNYRIWHLPVAPTEDELRGNPWGEEGENDA